MRVACASGRWLLRGRAGSVAALTALTAPILFLIIGFAIDYSYASYLNQRLAEAADSAVLAAVSQSAATEAGGYGNTSWLQTYGTGLFNENILQLPVSNVGFSLAVNPDGNGGVIANASYNFQSPTFFARLIGMSSIGLSGNVQSTAHPVTYVNYYILVDTSQSMGIGATQTDMQNLYNRVVSYNNGSGGDAGCVFGCHVQAPSNGGGLQPYTNEYLAHNISPAITLRIDSAVSAIQDIVAAAATVAGSTRNISIGLYTIQADPTVSGSYLGTITSPTSNYTSLTSLATQIDLGNNTSAGIGDSDFVDEFTALNNVLPANGSGVSATSPLNYVFIVTDGVTDVRGSCTDGHCTSAFNPDNCTPLKAKATVGVIYTTYLPIYQQNNPAMPLVQTYQDLVNPFVNQIAPNLESCATSSDYYFQATDGPAISAAMQALFLKTQPTTARLTY